MKSSDPIEISIINYLSGEMTETERKQFEKQLGENQSLQQQVDEMRQVQDQLGIWKNTDILLPEIDFNVTEEHFAQEKSSTSGQSIGSKPRFVIQNWMKYAAAFLGFLVVLQISGLRMSQNGNTVMLSFGAPNVSAIDEASIDAIVAKAIESYDKSQNNQFATFKEKMDSDFNKLGNAVLELSNENTSNIAKLEKSFNRNMDKQYVNLESMINGLEDNQRQELENSIIGFVEYIENKRAQDQYKIQNAFREIATAITNQQNQTNALLTSISSEDEGLKSY